MKFFKKTLAAAALTAALATSAQAAMINVGGVIWDPSSILDFNGTSATLTQSIAANGTLSGFGVVTTLNGNGVGVFCPGCEVTIQYGGFTPIGGALLPLAGGTGAAINYTGGWLNIFVDHTPDASATNPLLLDNTNTGDGALWLSLTGHNVGGVSLTGFNFSSMGFLAGQGLLDVTGGLAGGNIDTNTKADGADLAFTSTFTNLVFANIPQVGRVPVWSSGSATFNGDSIPEPATLALIGLGLLGAGALRRRQVGK